MRVSTSYIYGAAANSIADRQAQVAKIGDQISSGQRILSPADDPVGAARVIELENAKAGNDQYLANQTAARNSLSQTDSILASVDNTYSDMRSLLVQAGNASLSDGDRASLAQQLASGRDALMGLANSRDADGHYLFSGYKENQAPFVATGSGVSYMGDEGGRSVQVGASRSLPLTIAGTSLFGNVASGNGVFETGVATTNTGTGVVNVGDVADASALDGRSYQLVFHKTAAGTTYDVVDTAGAKTVSTGNAYTPNGQITVAGMRTQISGAPAEGDSFSMAPSTTRSVFSALDGIIAALRAPAGDNASRARLSSAMAAGIGQVDQAAQRNQLAQASVGSSLKELDSLDASANSADLQIQQQLSQLRDTDYAKAATELSQSQLTLDAAQKAYAKILGHSMFDFI